MEKKRPIRYWKPNMAALPPKLGRQIIRYIRNSPPFDFRELDAECERVNQELAKIGKGEGNEERVASGN